MAAVALAAVECCCFLHMTEITCSRWGAVSHQLHWLIGVTAGCDQTHPSPRGEGPCLVTGNNELKWWTHKTFIQYYSFCTPQAIFFFKLRKARSYVSLLKVMFGLVSLLSTPVEDIPSEVRLHNKHAPRVVHGRAEKRRQPRWHKHLKARWRQFQAPGSSD